MAKKYLDYDGLLYFWGKLKAAFLTDVSYNSTSKKIQKTKNGSTTDVVTLSTVATSGSYNDLSNKPTIPAGVEKTTTTPLMDGDTATIGSETKFAAGNHVHPHDTTRVPTTRTVNGKALSSDVTLYSSDILWDNGGGNDTVMSIVQDLDDDVSDLQQNKLNASEKGAANGVAPLNASSKIDSQYLPSYVDDVIEAYPRSGATELSSTWLSLTSGGAALTPEAGKIYVLMADSTNYSANSQFRWGGSTYVKLSDGGVSSITNAEIDTIVAS